ncbi:MAG: hypothetical protein JSS66_05755 [Armatimonadetes bacterium]|nr:hypothetical protein [Armatimonadota bacterium]
MKIEREALIIEDIDPEVAQALIDSEEELQTRLTWDEGIHTNVLRVGVWDRRFEDHMAPKAIELLTTRVDADRLKELREQYDDDWNWAASFTREEFDTWLTEQRRLYPALDIYTVGDLRG